MGVDSGKPIGQQTGIAEEAMNAMESRLMRIRRYPEDRLADLHDCEREAGSDWIIRGAQKMTEIDRDLGAYWDASKPEEERAREVDQFINSHAVKKAFAKMQASTNVSELVDIHEADWSVWKNAPMPMTGKGSGANRDKLKQLYEPRPLPYQD